MWPTQRNWDCSKNASIPEMSHISSTRYLIHGPAIWSRQFCEDSACGIVRAAWCVSCTGSSTRSRTRGLWGRQRDRLPPLFSRIHHFRATAGAGVHRRLCNRWLFVPWCRPPLRLCSTGSFPGSKICWRSWGSYHRPWLAVADWFVGYDWSITSVFLRLTVKPNRLAASAKRSNSSCMSGKVWATSAQSSANSRSRIIAVWTLVGSRWDHESAFLLLVSEENQSNTSCRVVHFACMTSDSSCCTCALETVTPAGYVLVIWWHLALCICRLCR